jgi:hypothetical protein
MDDFDSNNGRKVSERCAPTLPQRMSDALLNEREAQLRDEGAAWHRAYLPKFAAIAAQLRRDAEQRADDARPRLQLAQQFDELAADQSSYER